VATGRAERDPAADLRGALPPPNGGHFASITEPAKIGALLRSIEGYEGTHAARSDWRRSCSFDQANCGRQSGRNSISTLRSGAYLESA
jgi:hypothetical protein